MMTPSKEKNEIMSALAIAKAEAAESTEALHMFTESAARTVRRLEAELEGMRSINMQAGFDLDALEAEKNDAEEKARHSDWFIEKMHKQHKQELEAEMVASRWYIILSIACGSILGILATNIFK